MMSGSRGPLAAKQPLVVPMLLRLSHFRLNSYVVLVVSKQKGITLVFKTDPLQNVDITSTFDGIAVIQKFIQREIEGQLRQMFKEDLPGIIHRLSQQWVKAKVEAPYLEKARTYPRPPTTASTSGLSVATAPSTPLRPRPLPLSSPSPWVHSPGRATSFVTLPSASSSRVTVDLPVPPTTPSPPSDAPLSAFPDLEHYDPTYGLGSEAGSLKKSFGAYSRLFSPPRGLADLAEESRNGLSPEGSIDSTTWEGSASDVGSFSPSEAAQPEYEVIPAVGGGTVTRPRIIHSQAHTPSPLSPWSPSDALYMKRPLSISGHLSALSSTTPISPSRSLSASHRTSSVVSNPYFPRMPQQSSLLRPLLTQSSIGVRQGPRSYPATPSAHRSSPSISSPDHAAASNSNGMIPTPPSSDVADDVPRKSTRRPSQSSVDFLSDSPDDFYTPDPGPTRIILRPTVNNSASQLSILTHSNHTLSPFTRSMEHFTVRSVPPRAPLSFGLPSTVERQPVKARRKRTHRLGGAKRPEPPAPPSRVPSSEYGESEIHHYFRERDDDIPQLRYPVPRNSVP